MAHLHKAELRPSKVEIITAWVGTQPWFEGDASAEVEKVATFRFDDPEGSVGIETLLVTAGEGPILQVPLTYRDAPLPGGEAWFLGTMDHSVLGTRFVYDAVGDPAYLRALATAAFSGGGQADEYYEVDGVREFREPLAVVAGSGSTGSGPVDEPAPGSVATRDVGSVTVATAGILHVALSRLPGAGSPTELLAASIGVVADREVVSGTWQGHDDPVTFAVVGRD
ncbi:MAG: hypothetical protein JWP75_3009 [Frondihabitans sp.]|nr:hypothetical protein [Frondihabitans sp.]